MTSTQNEEMFMNPMTGSVDTWENWILDSKNWEGDIEAQLATLIQVKRDKDGSWIEA